MKSTLSDNKQLFNVKNIAYETTLDALADGEFGIYAEDSDTSIAATIVYATLPEKFRFVSKLNGKVYYSFDTIEKARMSNQMAKAYNAQVANVWETTVTHCECAEGFKLKINIDEQSLYMRDGFTWTHQDFVVGVTAEEIDCQCADGVLSGYDNNIITKMAVAKVNAMNSIFYEAQAKFDITGLTVHTDQAALDIANAAPTTGDIGVVTGEGVKQYDGAAWEVVGDITGVITDIDSFIANSEVLNKNADEADDILLAIVILGKVQATPSYRDLEVNYVFPRGVRIAPSISVNDGAKNFAFTETTSLVFEIGAGYDLRAEEFDCMSLSGTLNHYPQLSDGIQNSELAYQFENATEYDTLSFEFGSKKSGLEDVFEGSHKQFAVILATEDATTFTELQALFVE